MFFVYILGCSDGSYYVGSHRGEHISNRVDAHNEGLNRRAYTYKRRPVTLLWNEMFDDPADMVAAERRLKGWSRAKKEAYMRGDLGTLRQLAKSKSSPADPTKSKFYQKTGVKRPDSS